jgi:hypothetical protein
VHNWPQVQDPVAVQVVPTPKPTRVLSLVAQPFSNIVIFPLILVPSTCCLPLRCRCDRLNPTTHHLRCLIPLLHCSLHHLSPITIIFNYTECMLIHRFNQCSKILKHKFGHSPIILLMRSFCNHLTIVRRLSALILAHHHLVCPVLLLQTCYLNVFFRLKLKFTVSNWNLPRELLSTTTTYISRRF